MERNTPEQIRYDLAGPKVAKALSAHHFESYYVKTKAEAKALALSLIPKGDVVSFGGSVTAEEIGVLDELKNTHKMIDRTLAKDRSESIEIMRQGLLCDTFVTSSNAISADGTLVNIDGTGNRVAAMTFGPKSVIVLAGMNKVCADIESARKRARTVAAPTNVQRFNVDTPCKIDGLCHDCHSPECICTYIVETRNSRPAGRIKVILIGENLGM